jgi:hypothetical protein
VGVPDRQQKAADLPNRSALRLLTSLSLSSGMLPESMPATLGVRCQVLGIRCQVLMRGPAATKSCPPPAFCLLPTRYCLLP